MFLEGSVYDNFNDRITAIEELNFSDISSRVTVLEEADLITRCGTLETDVSSLKAWRADKAPASANLSETTNLPTVAVLGLLSTVTKAGVEEQLNLIKSEINGIKTTMRAREIMEA